MREAAGYYTRMIGASIRSQMQYRASFAIMSVGVLLITGIEAVGIWVLFDRFKSFGGWSLAEVALLYGLVNTAFAVADGAARGFDTFGSMVQTGRFDLLLLRPRPTALQVAAGELQLRRVGRLVQAVLVLGWAAGHVGRGWSCLDALTLVGAIAGGACLFYGLMIGMATMCFWTVESLELFNILTYGGAESGAYPITAYRPWFRRFFVGVVPLAAVSYFPAVALLGRPDPLGTPVWFQRVAPALGPVFLGLCLLVWQAGVRRYRSTGS